MTPEASPAPKPMFGPTMLKRLVDGLADQGPLDQVDWLTVLQSLEHPEDQVRTIILGCLRGASSGPFKEILKALGIHPLSVVLFGFIEWRHLGDEADCRAISACFLTGFDYFHWEGESPEQEPPTLRLDLGKSRQEEWSPGDHRLILPPSLAFARLSGDLTGCIDPQRRCRPELRLFEASGEISLPAKFGRDLLIHHCEATFQFHDYLEIWGRLEICDCPNLTWLPDIELVEELRLERCPALKELPPIDCWEDATMAFVGLRIAKADLFRGRCESRRQWHQGLNLQRGTGWADPIHEKRIHRLRLEKLLFLREIAWSPDATVHHLEILDCHMLESWPEHLLHVEGHLLLEGLPGLGSLPGDLRVDGTLTIRGCPRLRAFLDELQRTDPNSALVRSWDQKGRYSRSGEAEINQSHHPNV